MKQEVILVLDCGAT
ncbi:MAG: hypothetical protein ACLVEM_10485, partial [Escherichia coli]